VGLGAKRQILKIGSIVSSLLILVGCQNCSDHPNGDPPQASVDAGTTLSPAQSLTSDDGKVNLEVAEGALPDDETLIVTKLDTTLSGNLGDAYKFEPEGLQLMVPALMTFSYAGIDLEGNDPKDLRVAVLKDDHWMGVSLAYIDESAKTISAWTYHFSTWSLRYAEEHGTGCFICNPDVFSQCCASSTRNDTSAFGPLGYSNKPWVVSVSTSKCACANHNQYRLEDCYERVLNEELFGRCTKYERDCCERAGGEINSYGPGNCTCSSPRADECLRYAAENCANLSTCEFQSAGQPVDCEVSYFDENGQLVDGFICTDLKVDPNHCGACGTECSYLETCINKECKCRDGKDGRPGGAEICNGECVNLQSDPAHCGTCNEACLTGLRCESGTCEECKETICGNSCVNTSSSAAHCGGCDMACPAGEYCSGGCISAEAALTACTQTGLSGHICRKSLCTLQSTERRAFCEQMKNLGAEMFNACPQDSMSEPGDGESTSEPGWQNVDECITSFREITRANCPQQCLAGYWMGCFQTLVEQLRADQSLCDSELGNEVLSRPECQPLISAGCMSAEGWSSESESEMSMPHPPPGGG